ncbi:MAG: class I SAM-dependent methyltransferase [Lautropia sp.]
MTHDANRRRFTASAIAGAAAMLGGASLPTDARAADAFEALLRAPHRRPANVARDAFRHPAATLAFFGIRADSVVVEILPGSAGYYMEILAPFLREHGRYIAASRAPDAPAAYLADHRRLLERLRAEHGIYDRVAVTEFSADRHRIADDASCDFVLTFRNLHNWITRHEIDGALRCFHRALKPGGVLGVVDHRARADQREQAMAASGYVRQEDAIAAVERAGFRLAATSEINANPKDTTDHPAGVWTLPPTYRLGEVDREKYRDIGESDRFTLAFRKI